MQTQRDISATPAPADLFPTSSNTPIQVTLFSSVTLSRLVNLVFMNGIARYEYTHVLVLPQSCNTAVTLSEYSRSIII